MKKQAETQIDSQADRQTETVLENGSRQTDREGIGKWKQRDRQTDRDYCKREADRQTERVLQDGIKARRDELQGRKRRNAIKTKWE